MTQDERLIPAGRDLDPSLAELTQVKPYDKYDRYGSSNSPDTRLRVYLFIILKRKWLILSILLVVPSLVTIQVYREPSIYEGATTTRIEPKRQNLLQSTSAQVVINAPTDPNFWGTQLKLLQNPSLARQVILTLNLQKSPTFLGGQGQSSVFTSLKRIFSHDRSVNSSASAGSGEAVGEDELKERLSRLTPEELAALEPYEDAIAAGETIDPIPGTSLVTIKYQHTDPQMAQKIANTLAAVFIKNNDEIMASAGEKNTNSLYEEIAKYQDKIKKEQDARFAFAKANDLPLTSEQGSNLEQVKQATYSAQLLEAENQRRNQLAAYEAAKNSPDPFANPEVQKDARIIELRKKLTDLRDKETALLQKFTPEWPDVKQAQAQVKQVEDELAKAPTEVLASMKARADSASA